ncbi:MAG: hypothetical protein II499_08770 [Firmicutes bacterium]|nr:hypothetical protein [Bacillota bacterium]MBQ2456171.1 hypothetical protein [Bacillota bacterium]MBQ4234317.1 hypothetical protein [Bacillota bacterium]MBQ6012852.1 hypothetical protein [Bacillota bacterium]MBR0442308.1 hypothetical protein [Bacillota bacterium]
MALYPISREGVEAFNQLKKDLQDLNRAIEEEGEKLRSKVNSLEGGIGYLTEDIREYLMQIQKNEKASSVSIGTVNKLIERRVQQIEEQLAKRLS